MSLAPVVAFPDMVGSAAADVPAAAVESAPLSDDASKSAAGRGESPHAGAQTARQDVVAEWLNRTVAVPRRADPMLHRPAPRLQNAVPSAGRGHAGYGVQLFWPLLVVLAAITACALVFRRIAVGRRPPASSGVMTVLARHYLSPRQSLCLVRLGRRLLLVGVGPESVAAIAEIPEGEEASRIIGAAERSRPGSFMATLAALTAGPVASPDEFGPTPVGAPAPSVQPSSGPGQVSRVRRRVGSLRDRIRSLAGGTSSAEPI